MLRGILAVVAAAAAIGASTALAGTAPGQQTVYDPTLSVYWLANADLPATLKLGLTSAQSKYSPINADGSMRYATAVQWVYRLNHYKGTGWLGHNDWTLPITVTPYADPGCSGGPDGRGQFGLGCTLAPYAELYDNLLGLHFPASAVGIPIAGTGPFDDFQPYLYWSNTQVPSKRQGLPGGFDTFSFNTGWAGENQANHYMYVLPVLPGNPFGGTGHSGLESVDAGKAVYEPRADVTWLADADLPKTEPFDYSSEIDLEDGSMMQQTAASWVGALRTSKWLGQKRWLLPSPKQLQQLYDDLEAAKLASPQAPVVPVPDTSTNGFNDLQPYLYWSCAGASATGNCGGPPPENNQQWSFSFGNGYLGTDLVGNSLYAEVYYVPRSPRRRPTPPIRCHPLPGQHCPRRV